MTAAMASPMSLQLADNVYTKTLTVHVTSIVTISSCAFGDYTDRLVECNSKCYPSCDGFTNTHAGLLAHCCIDKLLTCPYDYNVMPVIMIMSLS